MLSAIIYGLGRQFEAERWLLENEFKVIGYSDKNYRNINSYVRPEKINEVHPDVVYITSTKYFSEIKKELSEFLNPGIKLLGRRDVFQWENTFANQLVRDKWIAENLSKIPSGKVLLDAGAGEAPYKKYCSHLKYIAQDFGEYAPENNNIALQMNQWDYSNINLKCDIINMPIENNSIDVILCTEVLEHLKDPVKAIGEFSRIICKGGGTTPDSSSLQSNTYGAILF